MSYLKSGFSTISALITNGHERSVKAKKNILASFVIRGLSIAISLVLVPLTIDYVNPVRYGIWLTLSSIIGWFSLFDIGLGNGLRNKLAEAIAKGEEETARIFVSTTYVGLCIIIGLLLLIFFCVNSFINWPAILNTSADLTAELRLLALVVFSFFCIRLIFQLLNSVLTANQEPAKASFFDLLGSLSSLIIIFILTKTTSGNLIYLGIALSFTPVLVLILASFWLYTHKYSKYAPSFRFIKLKEIKSLLSIGGIFFIIQIGALLLFQTSNIIIAQLFGPTEVTTYNVAYRLFGVLIMAFTIIMTPYWSAFTDAYTRNEWDWIKETFSKMQRFLLYLSISASILLIASPMIFRLWLHDKVHVPFSLSFVLSLYVVAISWITLNCFFLNGISKIRLQLYLYIASILVNIPLAIVLGKWIGISGIPLSNLIVLLIMGTILQIQSGKVITQTAKGIWNK
jgi:O-antigen/teichoic acid export membrane protein